MVSKDNQNNMGFFDYISAVVKCSGEAKKELPSAYVNCLFRVYCLILKGNPFDYNLRVAQLLSGEDSLYCESALALLEGDLDAAKSKFMTAKVGKNYNEEEYRFAENFVLCDLAKIGEALDSCLERKVSFYNIDYDQAYYI